MKIYIGTDHRGVEVKNEIINRLRNDYEVIDTIKVNSEGDDYVDFALEVAKNVSDDKDALGILMCGTGIGMSIAANKVKGVRAAHCTNIDEARLAKQHNCANIICMATTTVDEMYTLIKEFISTPIANEEKHLRRVKKIIDYENGEYNEL